MRGRDVNERPGQARYPVADSVRGYRGPILPTGTAPTALGAVVAKPPALGINL